MMGDINGFGMNGKAAKCAPTTDYRLPITDYFSTDCFK